MSPADPIALTELRRTKLIAVIRAATPASALAAANAVADGGITLIEVTYTVPDATRVMRELASRDGLFVGAGTVLTRDQARAALDTGARFIIAPNFSRSVAEQALEAGVMYGPGCYTTTEIVAARDAGAHVIKVYPVAAAGAACCI